MTKVSVKPESGRYEIMCVSGATSNDRLQTSILCHKDLFRYVSGVWNRDTNVVAKL